MIGFGITLLLSITFLAAIAVLVPSLMQAWRAYGALNHALSLCRDDRMVMVSVADNAKRTPRPRRHMRGAVRPIQPARTGALCAAA